MRGKDTLPGRNIQFALRVTSEELRLLKRRSDRTGRSMAELVRREGIEQAVAAERAAGALPSARDEPEESDE